VKAPVSRKSGKITIDVLAVRKAIQAGTLSDEDRETVGRFLPGVVKSIEENEVLLPNVGSKE
jgi:hypothetical protein